MNIYEKITLIKESAGSYYAKRIASQLIYALKLSKGVDDEIDDTVEKAVSFLYGEFERSGCITNEAAVRCEEILLPLSEKAKQYKLHCVAHAHIDMNWMWSFNETVAITLDTFRTVLKLMEEYPQLTFSQSQTSTYKIAEEYAPAMFEQIRDMVSSGRWEVTASTWVETDKNMPSGESLARHILYTKNYFRDKFSLGSDSLQLDFEPDTFGHSISVPEILSKGNVRYYYHCRGYEGHYIYNWRSPSGAQILVYREPAWYSAEITPDFIEYVPEFCRKNDTGIMLKVYGAGDHGGGPTRRDIETLLDIAEWPVAPTIEFSTYHRFFSALEKIRDRFSVVDHELNHVFTGCYSSQSRIKWGNRIAEDDLFSAEALSALAYNHAGSDDYTANYGKAWERVLFNHFHDILTGSGVRDTREYAMGKIQEALGYTYTGLTAALNDFAKAIDTSGIDAPLDKMSFSEGGGAGFKGSWQYNSSLIADPVIFPAERGNGRTRIMHVFNPSAFDREETVEVTIWDYPGKISQLKITDPEMNEVPFSHLEHNSFWAHQFDRFNIFVKVPSFGYSTYIISERAASYNEYHFPEQPRTEVYPKNILENDFIKAEFDDNNMILLSLIDKKTGKQLISGESAFFKLAEQNHRSFTVMYGNSWVEGYELRSENLNKTQKVFVKKQNYKDPLRQFIRYSIPFRKSNIDVTVSLDRNSSVLRFKTECDWHEVFSPDSGIPALKFVVPVDYPVSGYKYEIPFGVITKTDMNHDVPARSFAYGVNAEDSSAGIAVFSKSNYAYRGEKDSVSLTLIRSSQEPDKYPEYGMHDFDIGIGICADDNMQLFRNAALFTQPLKYIANTQHKGTLPINSTFLRTEGDIVISAVKLPENPSDSDAGKKIIIRLFDSTGKGTTGKLVFDRDIISADITDIMEEQPYGTDSERRLIIKGNEVKVDLRPFEVVTLKIKNQ